MINNDDFLISPVYRTIVHSDFFPLYIDERFAARYGLDPVEEAIAIESLMVFIDENEQEASWNNYHGIMSGAIRFTVSQLRNDEYRLDQLIERTDKELYQAKAAGRNQVKFTGQKRQNN